MEAVGFAAGVVGIAGAALTSSRALYQMVDEVRNAPQELSAISKDTRSLHDTVTSVQMALRNPSVIRILQEDQQLCDQVIRLEEPMQSCSAIITQLIQRIEPHLKTSRSGTVRLSSIDFRWVFKKKDILDCRDRLEASKLTLNDALTSVIFFCSLRSAGQNTDSLPSLGAAQISREVDAGSVLMEYAESIAPRSPSSDAVSNSELIASVEPADEGSTSSSSDLSTNSNMSRSLAEAPISAPQCRENARDKAWTFRNAVLNDNVEEVDRMLKEGYDVNHEFEDGNRALHLAAREGKTDIVRKLIARNADINAVNIMNRMTPLHYAVDAGQKSMVEILLDNGADISARDSASRTALGLAISRKHDETAILLVQRGAALLDRVDRDYTPLSLAVMLDRPRVVRSLLEKGKQLGQVQAMFDDIAPLGTSTLIYACRRGSIEIIHDFLEAGANIEVRDTFRHTPLLDAAINGRLEVVEYLISRGADRNARDGFGEDYLQILRDRRFWKYEQHMRNLESS